MKNVVLRLAVVVASLLLLSSCSGGFFIAVDFGKMGEIFGFCIWGLLFFTPGWLGGKYLAEKIVKKSVSDSVRVQWLASVGGIITLGLSMPLYFILFD